MDNYDLYMKYKVKYLTLKNINIKVEGGGNKKLNNKKNRVNFNIKNTKMNINHDKINIKYIENVSEPWFTLISLGLKTVEGRKNKGKFKEMQVGEIIEWRNDDFNPRSVLTKIIKKQEYNTFREYLETEGLNKCLPGITNLDNGLSVYFKYYTKEDEKEFGVIAIVLELI